MGRSAATLCCALACLAAAILPAAPAAAACPNEELRIAQGATALPGCMALEMASFPQKFSQPASLPSFSRTGERVLIKRAKASLPGASGLQHYAGDAQVASRTAQGWTVAPTAPPGEAAIIAGGEYSANPSIFTPDLGAWAQIGAAQSEQQVGVARIYRGALDGSFDPLTPLLVPIDNNLNAPAVYRIQVSGASSDLSVLVLRAARSSTSYFPEDPRFSGGLEEAGGDRNSYLAFEGPAGEPQLQLLARDKDGALYGGRCGAHLGGARPQASVLDPTFHQGAISADGQRIYFSTRSAQPWDEESLTGPVCDLDNGLRILERTTTPEGPVISEIAPGGGGPEAPGNDRFQAASADGAKVYFTSPRALAASDTDPSPEACGSDLGQSKGCDLYLYDSAKPPAERITQASAGQDASPGSGADVLSSIPAVSGDGARAYFVAQGVLSADPNPEGDSAQGGEPNLYLYEAATDTTSFIATLSADDAGAMWGTNGTLFGDAYAVPFHGPGLQGGGDGHLLAFASKAPVTEDDEDGGFRDVFRYDATSETLQRISKASPGGSDNGPFDVTVNPAVIKSYEHNFGEATRWVSEDSEIVAFATAEPLLASDEDEAANPYLWRSGQLGAVFAPMFGDPPAVAPVGDQIAFTTPAALLPRDIDTALDVYVAREGGGFPEPVEPTPCDPLQEGSCQQADPQPQAPAAPATSSFSGPGNAKEPPRCRKGQVKRKGRCVKARKGKGRKRANRSKGGRR